MKASSRVFVVLSLVCATALASTPLNDFNQEIYGFDASWPIKSSHPLSVLGDKETIYNDFMDTCRKVSGSLFSAYSCDRSEEFRIKMNNFQPMSMRNYTTMGFHKLRAPENVFRPLKEFWDKNRGLNTTEWSDINTYHNMWESPPTLINIQDKTIPGGGPEIQRLVWEMSRMVLEEWTGQHLAPCSMWGIRVYQNNSILAPHVDRNPLVSSAIINVDQDVDEPWPLEVWGHDGKPYNVTMEPGDMILYESHSVIHGRPFPLQGKYYANIFVHFEPIGAPRRLNKDDWLEAEEAASETRDLGLPPYVVPGSPWEKEWWHNNPNGWSLYNVDVGLAAQKGDFTVLENVAIATPEKLLVPDANGWTPLHEAVRAGELDVVAFLLDHGADVNEMTFFGEGESPLVLAEIHHGVESDIYNLLSEMGALSLGPEL